MPIREIAPLRAIILDADGDFRRRLASGLAEFGVDALPFDRVEEALAAVAARLPDVVLLCPFLPDGSGLQLVEALRTYDGATSTAVLALSHDVDGPPRMIAEVCDGFLVKPCSAEQVVDRIDRFFGTRTAIAVQTAAA